MFEKIKVLIGLSPKKKLPKRRYGPAIYLTRDEANETCTLLQSIIRDNTPNGDDLLGEELAKQCLLHNDPECFKERNKAFADAMQDFGERHGMSVEPEQETHRDAEEEYTYLLTICNIYKKLHKGMEAKND